MSNAVNVVSLVVSVADCKCHARNVQFGSLAAFSVNLLSLLAELLCQYFVFVS